MVAKVKTFSFVGIDVVEVEVEIKITNGLSKFLIVGLPDKAVGESKERVISALSSTGLSLPAKKITVNLAPADLQKEGSQFDLPIAVGILIEMGILSQNLIDKFYVLGELSLDGSINNINGIISASIGSNQRNCGIICPKNNGSEAVWAGNLEIIAPGNLIELINHLKGEQYSPKPIHDPHHKNFITKKYFKVFYQHFIVRCGKGSVMIYCIISKIMLIVIVCFCFCFLLIRRNHDEQRTSRVRLKAYFIFVTFFLMLFCKFHSIILALGLSKKS